MAVLDNTFIESLAKTGQDFPRMRWYLSAVVALGALNYPEEIPILYQRLLDAYLQDDQKFGETQIIREALTKVCGIMGAAKTGNALRALAEATPVELLDPVYHRASDTSAQALARGKAFHQRIYGRNKSFDPSKTADASPDYNRIVLDLFYGHIFSFDKILNDVETGQAIVSCLIGIDCQEQVRNHMIGMMYNGVAKEEIEMVREICLKVAERCRVKFKSTPIVVPET